MPDPEDFAEFPLRDLLWSNVTEPAEPSYVIVYEDGSQPRDARGRFRKREVQGFIPEKGADGGTDQGNL